MNQSLAGRAVEAVKAGLLEVQDYVRLSGQTATVRLPLRVLPLQSK